MKVKELIKELSKLPGENEVILQKDSEGNWYSPLDGVDGGGIFIPGSTLFGQAYSDEWTAEDADMSQDEWKKVLAGPRCVILYPRD